MKVNFNINKETAKSLFILSCFIFLVSCGNDEVKNDFVSINVKSPSPRLTETDAGGLVRFDFTVTSSSNPLSKFKIELQKTNTPTTTILDTSISGLQFDYLREFNIDNDILESTEYTYTLTAENSSGKKFVDRFIIFVRVSDKPLTESSGFNMFATGQNDAFGIKELRNLTTTVSDSSLISMFDTTTSNILSKVWRTEKKTVLFGKTNTSSLDYPKLTKLNLINVYESSQLSELVTNINENDIILYHDTEDNSYAAIKITKISNGDSLNRGFYEFNIKK